MSTASAAPPPFAFTFDPAGRPVLVQAGGSVLSTYTIDPSGAVTLVGSVADGKAALCWIASVGGFFYGANAGSAAISGFTGDATGNPALIGATGVVGSTAPGPIDLTGTPDGRFLYVETGGTGTIDGFAIQADGTLAPLPSVTGFGAAGIEGIAAD